MARKAGIERSISLAKKNHEIRKKILKVVLDQTITLMTAKKPKGGNPNLTQDLMNNRKRNHGTSH
ncbi:MAG TPA: hypothetical protein DEG10_15290 [Leclercia adecarboxylata]|jgi:hypothetical protein|uniref:Uncharacterized protein n=1 Tax=Leclercia adecarboxylata TaxID=83655 RepID=A0A855ELY5_9ENTR|nr:hypothetical protein CRX53_13635 [Leclercia adecarboxylata]HBX07197.1 hypothetical protein [Leclercia adecarboxylata]